MMTGALRAVAVSVVLLQAAFAGRAEPSGEGQGFLVKTLPLHEVQARASFPLLVVSPLPPSWVLEKAQIVWMPRDPAWPQLPPRQVVHLRYRAAGRAGCSLVQSGRVAREDSVWPAVITEVFFPNAEWRFSLTGSKAGTDYYLVTGNLSQEILSQVETLLTPSPRPDRRPRPPIGWRPKTLSLAEVERRARFRIWSPQSVPAKYSLRACQIVWVPQDAMHSELQARQAVRLVYRRERTDDEFSMIEVPHFPQVDADMNIRQIVSQDFFDMFGQNAYSADTDRPHRGVLSQGLAQRIWTRGGLDVCVVTTALSDEELLTLGPESSPSTFRVDRMSRRGDASDATRR